MRSKNSYHKEHLILEVNDEYEDNDLQNTSVKNRKTLLFGLEMNTSHMFNQVRFVTGSVCTEFTKVRLLSAVRHIMPTKVSLVFHVFQTHGAVVLISH